MFATLSVAKAVSLSLSLLLVALVLYASFQPSYAPLRSMVTERYLEAQGRAAWQVEQRRAAAEARERRRREAAFRKLVADGKRIMAEAERVAAQGRERERREQEERTRAEAAAQAEQERQRAAEAQRLEEEERIRNEHEERLRQERMAQEQQRRDRLNRNIKVQAIDHELDLIMQAAWALATYESDHTHVTKKWLHGALLEYLRRNNVSYSDVHASNSCSAIFSMDHDDLYLCAANVYEDGENSRHRGAPEELLTLATMIAHGDIDAGFSLSEYISYVLIRRAIKGENDGSPKQRLPRTVYDMTRIAPSLTGRFIRDRLSFEDEQYLLNVTVKTLERIDALTSERRRLDY